MPYGSYVTLRAAGGWAAKMMTTEADPRGDRATDGEAGPGRIEVTSAELARARRAYRGGLEAARAWRAFSPDPRHHDATYWTLIATLFAEPGMNRTTLIERVTAGAGVSRSTAERVIRDARESGLVCHRQVGTEVLMELSERLFAHCLGFFRSRMDRVRFGEGLGEDGGHRG